MSSAETIEKLKSILQNVTNCAEGDLSNPPISAEAPLFGFGLDSLVGVRFIMAVEKAFQITLVDDDLNLDNLTNLRTLAAYIERFSSLNQ